jgi:hypothetical protein
LIGSEEEVRIAMRQPDGDLRKPVIVWVVRLGDRLYLRSVKGPDGAWFRATRVRPEGRLLASGIEKDIRFVDADHGIDDDLDVAYAAKYGGADHPDVVLINSASARTTTMELVPV